MFNDQSTGGLARIVNSIGGIVDISGLTTSGMSAGSIEGAGIFFLASKTLTVGSNNLSTEVSGVISDGGMGTRLGERPDVRVVGCFRPRRRDCRTA